MEKQLNNGQIHATSLIHGAKPLKSSARNGRKATSQTSSLHLKHVCLVKQFAIFLGVVIILFLNVMEVLSVGGGRGALLDRQCMVLQRMCVLCLV